MRERVYPRGGSGLCVIRRAPPEGRAACAAAFQHHQCAACTAAHGIRRGHPGGAAASAAAFLLFQHAAYTAALGWWIRRGRPEGTAACAAGDGGLGGGARCVHADSSDVGLGSGGALFFIRGGSGALPRVWGGSGEGGRGGRGRGRWPRRGRRVRGAGCVKHGGQGGRGGKRRRAARTLHGARDPRARARRADGRRATWHHGDFQPHTFARAKKSVQCI